MYACADFHRGIILKEWEHKKLKMEMDDLERKMHYIENTKVNALKGENKTFSIQKYFICQCK